MLRRILTGLLDLLLPRRCFSCRRSGTVLCEICAGGREPAEVPDDPNTHALFSYHDPVIRRMIWALKYRGGQTIGTALGERLCDYLAEELSEASECGGNDRNFLVIPIPLAPTRARQRGYNQAAVIAQGFARRGGGEFVVAENILRRVRDTGSQTAIRGRAKRLANVRDAFAVTRPSAARGKQVIIIDDVLTTGGTVAAARRALEQAGAKIVIAAVLAHG